MNSININNEGYSAPNGADNIQNNWAAAYAKRVVDEHKTAPVLDHPDGSVTEDKLSQGVRKMISEAVGVAQSVTEIANNAKDIADEAKASADNAVSEAENAYDKSLDADSKADGAVLIANTAKVKSETAEQRAISAETKADAAVASASGAVQKAEKGIQYWQPNTEYKVGQWVYVGEERAGYDVITKCSVDHTSGEFFMEDAAYYGYWGNFVNVLAHIAERANGAGHADSADFAHNAHNDANGNDIVSNYATKAELKSAIGDIEVALDNIIAIQDELMGVSE